MRMTPLNAALILIFGFLPAHTFASLSNHPAAFKETAIKGGTKSVELHISNSISSPLGYTFTIPVEWVKVTPPAGNVEGNATLTVNLIFDASKLTDGIYNTIIILNDPHHGGISIPIELNVSTTAEVKEGNAVPLEFGLMQNYPNPFNPSTTISYRLPVSVHVSLKIYDLLGREMAILVNEFQNAGVYNYRFPLRAGQLTSGIYFYNLKTDRFTQTKKMILTK
jgi:hypothetical protein